MPRSDWSLNMFKTVRFKKSQEVSEEEALVYLHFWINKMHNIM